MTLAEARQRQDAIRCAEAANLGALQLLWNGSQPTGRSHAKDKNVTKEQHTLAIEKTVSKLQV